MPNHLLLLDVLSCLKLDEQFSFHDFTAKAFDAVAAIYYDSRLSLQNMVVDTGRRQKIFASDHVPVIADFAAI